MRLSTASHRLAPFVSVPFPSVSTWVTTCTSSAGSTSRARAALWRRERLARWGDNAEEEEVAKLGLLDRQIGFLRH